MSDYTHLEVINKMINEVIQGNNLSDRVFNTKCNQFFSCRIKYFINNRRDRGNQ